MLLCPGGFQQQGGGFQQQGSGFQQQGSDYMGGFQGQGGEDSGGFQKQSDSLGGFGTAENFEKELDAFLAVCTDFCVVIKIL